MAEVTNSEINSSKSFTYTNNLMHTFVRLSVLNKDWSTNVPKESYLIKHATRTILKERSDDLVTTINGVSTSAYDIFC